MITDEQLEQQRMLESQPMKTVAEILDGPAEERTLQAAYARIAMTEANARHFLNQAHGVTPKAALLKTLSRAVDRGLLTDRAKQLYRDYIAARKVEE